MAAGQAPLRATVDVAALTAAQDLLEAEAAARSASHGRRLRAVVALHEALAPDGFALLVVAELALIEQTSEQAATSRLHQALLLAQLEGGLEAVDSGLLSVEQASVLTRQLHGLAPAVQATVWTEARDCLERARSRGSVLPPARFAEVLRRAVIRADPADAVTRRRRAEAAGSVEWSRRDDGLGDLVATGISGPNLRAVLGRIRDRSQPFGGADERSAGKRRLDAFVDLLLGRDQLPLDDDHDPFAGDEPRHCGPRCGCRLGEPVPCGASVTVLVPLGAALGTTDELAELTGHGPLEPDLLQALLHNAPLLRPVWVDEAGVPVAVGDRVERPPARDPAAVRDALLRLAASRPPGPPVPRHPDDHPPPGQTVPRQTLPARSDLPSRLGLAAAALRGPVVLAAPHPVGTPGGYRVPTRLARLLRIRAPRCEWPGCGVASARCDLDHDVAWPYGPTCGCQLGPLCRRHHRIKQLLMTKLRCPGAVLWTDPTGRTWTSPSQHRPPEPSVRPLPPLRGRYEELDDDEDDGVDAVHAPDPLTVADPDGDPYLRRVDDGWGDALDDPTRWDAAPPPDDGPPPGR